MEALPSAVGLALALLPLGMLAYRGLGPSAPEPCAATHTPPEIRPCAAHARPETRAESHAAHALPEHAEQLPPLLRLGSDALDCVTRFLSLPELARLAACSNAAAGSTLGALADAWERTAEAEGVYFSKAARSESAAARAANARALLRRHRSWRGGVIEARRRDHRYPVGRLAASARWLASADDGGGVRLCDAASGASGVLPEAHQMPVSALAVSDARPGSPSWLASGSGEMGIRVWRIREAEAAEASARGKPRPLLALECARLLEGHTDTVWALATLPRGLLCSSSDDRTIRIWRVESGEELCRLRGHTRGVHALAWCADGVGEGGLLASGSYDGTVRLWDLHALLSSEGARSAAPSHPAQHAPAPTPTPPTPPRCTAVLEGHTSWVVALAPVGDRLASASFDTTCRVWHGGGDGWGRRIVADARPASASSTAAASSPPCLVLPHSHPVVSLCRVGSRIASGSYDHSVRIWCPLSGACVHTLAGHTGVVSSLASLGGGLLSASTDNTVRLWGPAGAVQGGGLEGHALPALCLGAADGGGGGGGGPGTLTWAKAARAGGELLHVCVAVWWPLLAPSRWGSEAHDEGGKRAARAGPGVLLRAAWCWWAGGLSPVSMSPQPPPRGR